MNDETKPVLQSVGAKDQTVEEAVENLDAAKESVILSPIQAKIADANRSTVTAAISALDKSSKGATASIFAVMRSCVTSDDASLILQRLEYDWRRANDMEPLPASWKSTKSPMLKAFDHLPKLVTDATAAVEVNLNRASVHDAAKRQEAIAALYLDDPAKLQPLAFGPQGYAQWKAALAALKVAVNKAKEPDAIRQSGGTASGLQSGSGARPADVIPEYDTTGFPAEVIQARMRALRAVKAAVGKVPVQELVNLLTGIATTLENRVRKHDEKLASLGSLNIEQRKTA